MSTTGETHNIEFWRLASPELGAIRIAVGEAWSSHRMMIKHDSKSQAELGAGASMSTARWTNKMEFWASPAQLQDGVLAQRGTPISAGTITSETEGVCT